MAPRTDDSLATLLLTNHLTDTAGEPFGPKGFWDLVEAVGEPGRLLGMGSREVVAAVGDDARADRVLTLLDASTQLAFALERLEAQGFSAITPFDDTYPQRLRERLAGQAPPGAGHRGPGGAPDPRGDRDRGIPRRRRGRLRGRRGGRANGRRAGTRRGLRAGHGGSTSARWRRRTGPEEP